MMLKQLSIFLVFSLLLDAFSFENTTDSSPSNKVKSFYLCKAEKFKDEASLLNKFIKKGDESQIKEQFFKTRYAYKQIEIFAEYFFSFYAVRLNGPPIPFFEEADADVLEQLPTGMQLIESDVFPHLNKKQKDQLLNASSELVRYATEMPTINE